jgi:hypothetical protein
MVAVCALVLSGCFRNYFNPEPDTALIGTWTNNAGGDLHAGLVKEFTINNNFTFEASINPTFIREFNQGYAVAIGEGADDEMATIAGMAAVLVLDLLTDDETTRWTVTGKLSADGKGGYVMSKLAETTGKPDPAQTGQGDASAVVAGFNGHHVKFSFMNDEKNAFHIESAESGPEAVQVTAFSGGNYTRKISD